MPAGRRPFSTLKYCGEKYNEETASIGGGLIYLTYFHALVLIAIMLGLERSLFRDAQIVGLCVRQFVEFYADLREVQTGHFLVEYLWQHIYFVLVLLMIGPKLDLGQGLVGE